MKRIIIGITGASGAIYGIRILEVLKEQKEIETHLIISPSAKLTIAEETNYTLKQVENLAHVNHSFTNIGASIASGSFKTLGMIIAPCSVKTLSGVANCTSDSLLLRAADVTLKERRKLVLMVRETPLHQGHIRLMGQASEMGAIIAPPVPAFYHHPKSINDIVDHSVNRALDLAGIELDKDLFERWKGTT